MWCYGSLLWKHWKKSIGNSHQLQSTWQWSWHYQPEFFKVQKLTLRIPLPKSPCLAFVYVFWLIRRKWALKAGILLLGRTRSTIICLQNGTSKDFCFDIQNSLISFSSSLLVKRKLIQWHYFHCDVVNSGLFRSAVVLAKYHFGLTEYHSC